MRINKAALRPHVYDGLIRLGNKQRDGGYVVPESLLGPTHAVLSLGLAEEWTFDIDFAERNPTAVIIGVDHSISPWKFFRSLVRGLVKRTLYSVLFNKRKASKYNEMAVHYGAYFRLFTNPNRHLRKMVAQTDSSECVSFTTLIEMVPTTRDHSVAVKIDIESAEYDVIGQIVASHKKINFITGEFHELASHTERFNDALAQLLQHFSVVHVHGNNYGAYSDENNFPDTVEITFVHNSLMPAHVMVSEEAYPRPGLDVPNNPDKPDYVLVF